MKPVVFGICIYIQSFTNEKRVPTELVTDGGKILTLSIALIHIYSWPEVRFSTPRNKNADDRTFTSCCCACLSDKNES